MNGEAELTEFVIGEPTIEKSLEMIWVYLEGLRVESNRRLVIALLAGRVALGVERFSPSFQLWVERETALRRQRLLLCLGPWSRSKLGLFNVCLGWRM